MSPGPSRSRRVRTSGSRRGLRRFQTSCFATAASRRARRSYTACSCPLPGGRNTRSPATRRWRPVWAPPWTPSSEIYRHSRRRASSGGNDADARFRTYTPSWPSEPMTPRTRRVMPHPCGLATPHGCGFATPHPCGTKKTQWKKTQGTRHNPPRLRRVGGGLRCPPHLLSRAGRGEGANANRPPCLYASRTPRRTASPRRSTTPAWPLATPRCRHRSRALWPGTPAPCTTSCTRPTR